ECLDRAPLVSRLQARQLLERVDHALAQAGIECVVEPLYVACEIPLGGNVDRWGAAVGGVQASSCSRVSKSTMARISAVSPSRSSSLSRGCQMSNRSRRTSPSPGLKQVAPKLGSNTMPLPSCNAKVSPPTTILPWPLPVRAIA